MAVVNKVMEGEELTHYRELDSFQKSVVDSLKVIGFQHKRFYTWECPSWNDVNMKHTTCMSQLIRHFREDGEDQKRFEIQRVLGL